MLGGGNPERIPEMDEVRMIAEEARREYGRNGR